MPQLLKCWRDGLTEAVSKKMFATRAFGLVLWVVYGHNRSALAFLGQVLEASSATAPKKGWRRKEQRSRGWGICAKPPPLALRRGYPFGLPASAAQASRLTWPLRWSRRKGTRCRC